MASGSTKEYRLVIGTDFAADWDDFVLQCRQEGKTPDEVVRTMVLERLSGPAKGATPLSMATREGTAESKPEPSSELPELPGEEPKTKPKTKVAKKAKKATRKPAKRPATARKEAPPPKRPMAKARKPKPRPGTAGKGPGPKRRPLPRKPKGRPPRSELLDLPSLEGGGAPPAPKPRTTSGGTLLELENALDGASSGQLPNLELQLPANTTPKFKLLELLRQLDMENEGIERDEVLRQARFNNIEDPEATLNKLIRRGLVHIYQGRCRTG